MTTTTTKETFIKDGITIEAVEKDPDKWVTSDEQIFESFEDLFNSMIANQFEIVEEEESFCEFLRGLLNN